jgi:hypothetical protein
MRCSRCETELPDSATVCSRCGTPTQTSVTPSGFSYLPLGAPPWPTTVPQQLMQPTASIATAAALPAPPARRPLSKVLLTIAVLILIPLLGAGITFASLYAQGKIGNSAAATQQQAIPTPTAQARTGPLPTPTSFKQISDKNLNVSLKYPSDWTADAIASDASTVQQHIYSQQVGISFYFVHIEPSQSSQFTGASDVNQANLASLQAQGANIQVVSAQNPQPQFAGTTWTEMDGTFPDSDGNTIHVISISVKHNGAYYTILSLIPQTYFTEASQKYIQPMLDSVKFLS